jgi:glycosyltransferase involved in cell wall biosynthesis
MDERTRFSVIIPAYNSAAYIEKALQSVKNQSYSNYELIVVCDSCLDRTEEIAMEYGADTYSVNFHCDGLTRNYGLDRARGDWILFLDDDDWFLHEFAFDMLNQVIQQTNHDVIAFSFIWKGVGYSKHSEDKLYVAAWNKCWKRSAIGDTRFSNSRTGDADLAFHNGMMAKALKIGIWDQPLYYYNYLRKGSQTEKRDISTMHPADAAIKYSVLASRTSV